MNVTQLQARKSKKPERNWVNIDALLYEHADYTEIRIPKCIPSTAVHASATEKAVPMVTVVARSSDPKHTGSVTLPMSIVAVTDEIDGGGNVLVAKGTKVDFPARINAFNLFL